jgi:hypothetical protein
MVTLPVYRDNSSSRQKHHKALFKFIRVCHTKTSKNVIRFILIFLISNKFVIKLKAC